MARTKTPTSSSPDSPTSIIATMPPQMQHVDASSEEQDHGAKPLHTTNTTSNNMRRVVSDAEMSVEEPSSSSPKSYKEYRMRKSSLIG